LCVWEIIIIIIIKQVLLKCRVEKKDFKNTVHQSTLQKKLRSANSEIACQS